MMTTVCALLYAFFFNDTATTEIYTLSLHDALPIWDITERKRFERELAQAAVVFDSSHQGIIDRKSTRLNSSHTVISYAVFCLKKKETSRDEGRPRPCSYNASWPGNRLYQASSDTER